MRKGAINLDAVWLSAGNMGKDGVHPQMRRHEVLKDIQPKFYVVILDLLFSIEYFEQPRIADEVYCVSGLILEGMVISIAGYS